MNRATAVKHHRPAVVSVKVWKVMANVTDSEVRAEEKEKARERD